MGEHQMWEGCWHDLKAELHRRWDQLRDDDLESARGNLDALVGTIQEKTGATRDEVERYLNDTYRTLAARGQQAVETAREYANVAADRVNESSEFAAEAMREGYEQAQEIVRRRPLESLAFCFGLGVVTGVVVGLALRSK